MSASRAILTSAAVLLAGIAAAPCSAQVVTEPLPGLYADVVPTRVMVLGVFHFHNPGADYAQFEGIDVLEAHRQVEIERVVESLAAFAPGVIAVEDTPDERTRLDSLYRGYRTGDHDLTSNEIQQLGFRLARRLDLDGVEPVDYRRGLALDSVMAYASQHDDPFAARLQGFVAGITATLDRLQREATIGESLRYMNDPANLDIAHTPYVDMTAVGAGDGYVGARATSAWYDRNIHIFANLARLAVPGGRVLLIIGQGHAPILRDLVRAHPAMELVEALTYLAGDDVDATPDDPPERKGRVEL